MQVIYGVGLRYLYANVISGGCVVLGRNTEILHCKLSLEVTHFIQSDGDKTR